MSALTKIAFLGGVACGLSYAFRQRKKISFNGLSVVITGGSRGLGLLLARQFAGEGAKLTILARDEEELKRAAEDLRARGAKVLALTCDVRDRQQVQKAIGQTIGHYGRVDVLINNAGVIHFGPYEHMALEDFEEAMAVHAWAPLYATLAVVPQMRRQGGGRIVNITSVGGKLAVPHLLPYAMSKFASVGLSDGLRAELAKDGIDVTTVVPGLMRTGSHLNALMKGRHNQEFTLFALSASLPLFSMNAQHAAKQIVEACRYGEPQLVLTPQARSAIFLNAALPNVVARLTAFAGRWLPSPTNSWGDEAKPGWASQSRWAPSLLTRLGDRAAEENNELS